MIARHVVAAHVDHLAVDDPDPPVEGRVQELLGQQQGGLAEHAARDAHQFLAVAHLVHAAREGAVRDLDHHRVAQLLLGDVQAAALDDHGARDRHLVRVQQFLQIHLVGAAQNGLRVVDDRQVFRFGALGETVGVMIDVGGGADEQRIELRQFPQVVAGDALVGDAQLGGGALEALQGLFVGRRQGLVRIDQDGQVETRGAPAPRGVPAGAQVALQGVHEQGPLLRIQLRQARHAQTADADRALAAAELEIQQRRRQGEEQLARQIRQARLAAIAEGDQKRAAAALRHERGVQALQVFVQGGQQRLAQIGAPQFQQSAHRGQDALAARLSQQRAIIADALVLPGMAQIDDPRGRRVASGSLLGEVLLGGEQRHIRPIGAPVAGALDDDQVRGHLFESLPALDRTTAACSPALP